MIRMCAPSAERQVLQRQRPRDGLERLVEALSELERLQPRRPLDAVDSLVKLPPFDRAGRVGSGIQVTVVSSFTATERIALVSNVLVFFLFPRVTCEPNTNRIGEVHRSPKNATRRVSETFVVFETHRTHTSTRHHVALHAFKRARPISPHQTNGRTHYYVYLTPAGLDSAVQYGAVWGGAGRGALKKRERASS